MADAEEEVLAREWPMKKSLHLDVKAERIWIIYFIVIFTLWTAIAASQTFFGSQLPHTVWKASYSISNLFALCCLLVVGSCQGVLAICCCLQAKSGKTSAITLCLIFFLLLLVQLLSLSNVCSLLQILAHGTRQCMWCSFCLFKRTFQPKILYLCMLWSAMYLCRMIFI